MQRHAIPISKHGVNPFPVVCAPLVARTRDALATETAKVAAWKPDLLEWRVDFFSGIGDTNAVLAAANDIRNAAGGIPILFTRRNSREGGEKIALDEPRVIDMYRAVCQSGLVDLIDFEMDNDAAHVQAVREMAKDAGLPLILSFHDFSATPPAAELVRRFARAQALGGDVAKVAVMPRAMDDVLTLLGATQTASTELSIPVVSMAMGGLGAVTRMCGWAFGSAMTFAVGESASAPGQMPIEDVQAAIAMLRKAYRG